jgi:U4/U6 small nuclear ribonucleoprotein SNU13
MTDQNAAFPLADEQLQQKLLDLTQQASHYRQLKKVRPSTPSLSI